MTLRHCKDFEDASDWATEKGCAQDLVLVHHLFQLSDYSANCLSLVLEFFEQPAVKELLEEWSPDPIAVSFRRLAGLFSSSDQMLRRYSVPSFKERNKIPKLPRSKTLYLLKCFAKPIPRFHDQEEDGLFLTFLIWLIVRAGRLAKQRNLLFDEYLEGVAAFLQDVEPSSKQGCTFLELMTRTRERIDSDFADFDLLNDVLASEAHQLLRTAVSTHGSTSTEANFFRSVSSVAAGKTRSLTGYRGPHSSTYQMLDIDPPHQIDWEVGDIGTYQLINAPDDGLDEDAALLQVRVDPSDSPGQQALSARSVWLQSVEDLHYLPMSIQTVLPHEIPALNRWVDKAIADRDEVVSVGGALTWIAIKISRSMARTAGIEVSSVPGDEWRVCPKTHSLHRISPRKENSWDSDESTHPWIREYGKSYRIPLPEAVASAFGDKLRFFEGRYLGDLWLKVLKKPLDSWFNAQMTDDLSRVSSGKLGRVLPNQAYDALGNAHIAHLISSHPKSGLAGGTAYARASAEDISQAMRCEVVPDCTDKSAPLIGSRLNPVEEMLHEAINRAHLRAFEERTASAIEAHNNFSAMLITGLLAGTGARPVRDPFEKPSHFSFDKGIVYVCDKTDQMHSGRIVPIPKRLNVAIHTSYLKHLARLAEEIFAHHPALSKEIRLLSQQEDSELLPFFFFLSDDLEWYSVSEKSIRDLRLFDWPLPLNLFRHRYIQGLVERGVDPEIVDGFVGHSEHGCSSYGDNSMRCWISDAASADDAINALYDELGFSFQQPTLKLVGDLSSPHLKNLQPRLFGAAYRHSERQKNIAKARRRALTTIELFLMDDEENERSLTELTFEELDALILKMVRRDDGLPHNYAYLRYNVLLEQLEKAREASPSARPRIQRRYYQEGGPQSNIDERLPRYLALNDQLREVIQSLLDSGLSGRPTQLDYLYVAAVALCVHQRIGYAKLLCDVAEKKNFRLIHVDEYCYLEYSEVLDPADWSTAVQRHRIHPMIACWLDRGLGRQHQVVYEEIPSRLAPLVELLRASFGDQIKDPFFLLGAIAEVTNQTNAIHMPGVLAAGLSDRRPPTSLSFVDWQRLVANRRLRYAGTQSDNSQKMNAKDEQLRLGMDLAGRIRDCMPAYRRSDIKGLPREELQTNARQYFKQLQKQIANYTVKQFQNCAARMDRVSDSWKDQVSPAVLFYGYWFASRVRSGKKFKKKEGLAPASLQEYFSALAGAFRDLLYESDLVEIDADQLTMTYSSLLEFKSLSRKDLDICVLVLKNFHLWARKQGVVDPHWDELQIDEKRRTVSPGYVTEEDYSTALDLIIHSLEINDRRFQFALAFVLICTRRCGLRTAEAVALGFDDLVLIDGTFGLLVRPNADRRLKSSASERFVRMLSDLSEQERSVLKEIRDQCIALPKKNSKPRLLNDGVTGNLAPWVPQISPALIVLLRLVTRNPDTVLHHDRHGFANDLASIIAPVNAPISDAIRGHIDADHVREVTLGKRNGPSRRQSMMLARQLGHANPNTTFRSYVHQLSEWVDEWLEAPKRTDDEEFEHAVTLADFEQLSALSREFIKDRCAEHALPTVENVLKVFRLVSLGDSAETACGLLSLHPSLAGVIERVLVRAGERMDLPDRKEDRQRADSKEQSLEFLSRVTMDAWIELIETAQKASFKAPQLKPISFDSLPYRLSQKRNVLMLDASDAGQVKDFLSFFGVENAAYYVVRFVEEENTLGSKEENPEWCGFALTPAQKAGNRRGSLRKPRFTDPTMVGSPSFNEFSVLNFMRQEGCVIRDSFDLAVSFLAYGITAAVQTDENLVQR